MKRQTLWITGTIWVVMTAVAFIVAGCGGSKAPNNAKNGNIIGSGRTGEIVLTVDWGKSRIIPPSTVRIDVTITGDGLVNPFRGSITRPSGQTTVTKVYTLPVGFKHVTAEAKDSNDQTVAAGSGTVTLTEGQRTNLEIVMSEITARTVLVRTFRGKQQAPPDFIAYQDGNGPWQIAQGSGEYTLTINDPAGRYGVAIVCVRMVGEEVSSVEVEVNVLHATVNELSQINHVCEEAQPPINFVTVSGTVSGLGSDEIAQIAVGDFSMLVFARYGNTYSIQVPPGTYDLIAAKFPEQQWGAVNKALIQHDVVISGDTTINIDFNSPDAFVPETQNAVVNGVLSGEEALVVVHFLSHNGTEIPTGNKFGVPLQFQFAGIPTAKQFGNDIHRLSAIAMNATSSRLIERYFKAPTDISATLPSPFSDASVTVATTNPYARFTASWDAYSGAQAYFAEFGGEAQRARARRQLVSNPRPSRPKERSRQGSSTQRR
ncbi:MAG: hypothetical protein ACK4I8_09885, partial [Armatimonadota bacterium]